MISGKSFTKFNNVTELRDVLAKLGYIPSSSTIYAADEAIKLSLLDETAFKDLCLDLHEEEVKYGKRLDCSPQFELLYTRCDDDEDPPYCYFSLVEGIVFDDTDVVDDAPFPHLPIAFEKIYAPERSIGGLFRAHWNVGVASPISSLATDDDALTDHVDPRPISGVAGINMLGKATVIFAAKQAVLFNAGVIDSSVLREDNILVSLNGDSTIIKFINLTFKQKNFIKRYRTRLQEPLPIEEYPTFCGFVY